MKLPTWISAAASAIVAAALPACDYVIVVADGNKDGLFTKLTGNGKIPLDSVEKITKVGDPLAKAFK